MIEKAVDNDSLFYLKDVSFCFTEYHKHFAIDSWYIVIVD
jgi:hypothetical protein